MKAFASNLKKARAIKGWTQDKAASLIGIGRPAYASYEEGRCLPRYEAQIVLEEVFGIKDWRGFVEDLNFDHVKGMRAGTEPPESVMNNLKEFYTRADTKTRLAVNILLGLVEVE